MARIPLDPEWVVGFVDGEGCFTQSSQGSKYKWNKRVYLRKQRPRFDVGQKDEELLMRLKDFFGVGHVREFRKCHPGNFVYTVNGWKGCDVISRFFQEHPLQTKHQRERFKKWVDQFFSLDLPIKGKNNASMVRVK